MTTHCACGKPLDKVPAWLAEVKVEFVCNNCPKRQMKNISQVTLEAPAARVVENEDLSAIESLDEDEEEA